MTTNNLFANCVFQFHNFYAAGKDNPIKPTSNQNTSVSTFLTQSRLSDPREFEGSVTRIGFQKEAEGMSFIIIAGWSNERILCASLPITKFEQLSDGTVTFAMYYIDVTNTKRDLCGCCRILDPNNSNSNIQLIEYDDVPAGSLDILHKLRAPGELELGGYTLFLPGIALTSSSQLEQLYETDSGQFIVPSECNVSLGNWPWVMEQQYEQYEILPLPPADMKKAILRGRNQLQFRYVSGRLVVADNCSNILYKIKNQDDIVKNDSKLIIENRGTEAVIIPKGFQMELSFTILGGQNLQQQIKFSEQDDWEATFQEIGCWRLQANGEIQLPAEGKLEFFLSNIYLPSEGSGDFETLLVSWKDPVSARPLPHHQYLEIFLFDLKTQSGDSLACPLQLTFANPEKLALAEPNWNVKQNGLKLLHPEKGEDEIFINNIKEQIITSRLAFSICNGVSTNQPLLKKKDGHLAVSIDLGQGSQPLSAFDGKSVQSNPRESLLSGVDLIFAGSTLGNNPNSTTMIKQVDETSGRKTWRFDPRGINFLQANEEIWFVFEGLCPGVTPGQAKIQIAYYGIEGYKDSVFITYVRKTAPKPCLIAPSSPQKLTVQNPWRDLKLSWALFGSASVSLMGKTKSGLKPEIEIAKYLPGVVSDFTRKLDKSDYWQHMDLFLRVSLSSGGWEERKIAEMTYTGPWGEDMRSTAFTSDWMPQSSTPALLASSISGGVNMVSRISLRYSNTPNDQRGWYLLLEIIIIYCGALYSPLNFFGGYIKLETTDISEDGIAKFTTQVVEFTNVGGSRLSGAFNMLNGEIKLFDPTGDANSPESIKRLLKGTSYGLANSLDHIDLNDASKRPSQGSPREHIYNIDWSELVLKRNNRRPLPFIHNKMVSNWTNAPTSELVAREEEGSRVYFEQFNGEIYFVIEKWKRSQNWNYSLKRWGGRMQVVNFYLGKDETVTFQFNYFLYKGSTIPLRCTGHYRIQNPTESNFKIELLLCPDDGRPSLFNVFWVPQSNTQIKMWLVEIIEDGAIRDLSTRNWWYNLNNNLAVIGGTLGNENLAGMTLYGESGRCSLDIEGLSKGVMQQQDFSNHDFSNTDLTGSNFDEAKLQQSDFTDANLNNASLVNADLVLANFTDANLNAANLSGGQLNYAKLCNANLNSANLEGASLIGANLSDADFTHANLTNANLATAMVTGTRFSQSAAFSDEQKQDLIDQGAIFVEEPKLEMGQLPEAPLDARAFSAPTQSLDAPQRLDLIEQKLDALLQYLQLTPSNPQSPTLPADEQQQALTAQSVLLNQPEETVASNADFVTHKPPVQTQYL